MFPNNLENGNEKKSFIISHLEDYDISPKTGFLQSTPPLRRLPDTYYEPWENLIDNFHNLLLTGRLRESVGMLPILRTDKLKNSAEYKRAFLVLSILAHACIAIPWVKISDYLNVAPVMNHAALTLWNWRLISPDEEPSLNNLATLMTFTNTIDESWFYLVTIVIEFIGGKALTAIISAIQSAHDKNNRQLIESLKIIGSTIDEITKVLLRIYEKCDSYVFYQKIRPYLSGWYNDEDLPNGLKYEGVDGCDENGNPTYRQYGGGSAGQSSLIQSLDIALNIEHHPTVTKPITNNISNYKYSHESSNENLSNNYNNTSKKGHNIQQQQQPYIYKIRQNIPGNHRRFLEDLTKAAIIRDYIISCIECDGNMEINGKLDSSKIAENNELVEAYNDCLNKMSIFRSKHLQIVCVYIIQARNKSSKVELDSNNKDVTNGAVTSGSIINGSVTNGTISNVRGTGGTDLMPFLKQMREETKSKEIKNFKGLSDFKEQKKITRTNSSV
nr:1136_t:CDS:2 [Entrophospora candida]